MSVPASSLMGEWIIASSFIVVTMFSATLIIYNKSNNIILKSIHLFCFIIVVTSINIFSVKKKRNKQVEEYYFLRHRIGLWPSEEICNFYFIRFFIFSSLWEQKECSWFLFPFLRRWMGWKMIRVFN